MQPAHFPIAYRVYRFDIVGSAKRNVSDSAISGIYPMINAIALVLLGFSAKFERHCFCGVGLMYSIKISNVMTFSLFS
jgi:hypothetical protein